MCVCVYVCVCMCVCIYRIREKFQGRKVSWLYELKTVRVKMFAFARK